MYNYAQVADNVLIGMNDYLTGFSVHHSNIIYNFYKETVFTMSYDDIVNRLSTIYKVPPVYFNTDKLNTALTILHKRYKEYEKFYMHQRDVEADMSKVSMADLDNITLTLERFTAAFIRHLMDLKNGFNLMLLVEHQQKFYKANNMYDTSEVDKLQQQPTEAINATTTDSELTMKITNMGDDNIPSPRITPQEFLIHLKAVGKLCNEYFDNNLKPGTKYNLEMRLVFP